MAWGWWWWADPRDLISQKMKVVKIPILEHHSRDTITQKGTNFPFRALHIDTFYHDWVQSKRYYVKECAARGVY